jgi:hypothetical protein
MPQEEDISYRCTEKCRSADTATAAIAVGRVIHMGGGASTGKFADTHEATRSAPMGKQPVTAVTLTHRPKATHPPSASRGAAPPSPSGIEAGN